MEGQVHVHVGTLSKAIRAQGSFIPCMLREFISLHLIERYFCAH